MFIGYMENMNFFALDEGIFQPTRQQLDRCMFTAPLISASYSSPGCALHLPSFI
jgi:hypothetical protein